MLAPPPSLVPPANLHSTESVAFQVEQALEDPSVAPLPLPVSLTLPPQPAAAATASAAAVAAALAGSVLAGSGLAMPGMAPAEDATCGSTPAASAEGVVAPAAPAAGAPPCCKQGHTLVFTTASQALQCDVCGANVAEGDMTWSCEPCDFDQCSNCAKAQA